MGGGPDGHSLASVLAAAVPGHGAGGFRQTASGNDEIRAIHPAYVATLGKELTMPKLWETAGTAVSWYKSQPLWLAALVAFAAGYVVHMLLRWPF